MTLANSNTGILVVNTNQPEVGSVIAGSTERIIGRLGEGFHVRTLSALGDLSGPVPEQGVILAGSPYSVTSSEVWLDEYRSFVREMIARGKGILGICFGHQLLAEMHGGKVQAIAAPQIDAVEVALNEEGRAHPLFDGLNGVGVFGASHFDHVTHAPHGTKTLANTPASPHYALDIPTRRGFAWGVQFHPEMHGQRLGEIVRTKREHFTDWKARVRRVSQQQLECGGQVLRNYGKAVATQINR